jgi:hypothetical protein
VPRAPYPCEDEFQWKLRLRDELHQKLDAAAKQNRVSRNEEAVSRLARSFDRDPVISIQADVKRLLKLHGGG